MPGDHKLKSPGSRYLFFSNRFPFRSKGQVLRLSARNSEETSGEWKSHVAPFGCRSSIGHGVPVVRIFLPVDSPNPLIVRVARAESSNGAVHIMLKIPVPVRTSDFLSVPHSQNRRRNSPCSTSLSCSMRNPASQGRNVHIIGFNYGMTN